ncbi:acyl-phosphate glycerol 3-phosphate acyltransferase [Solemya velum gill symbiont]|uniref:AMP-binding protein n=1 Tax=Solemya velum gill symbiont TaxID=2340 RepID=UPI000996CD50|nr:AMP-binding protein [Solemya velum gill symbiont]OOY44022.1 acyl-phosphate glycerol 3-phosphate acyltransferase [Solemya velum gill symbiont]OOY47966.1 acyl-phosphate glycerol 3-phosphate acyltransferase [Solemya velum gill symbiont]
MTEDKNTENETRLPALIWTLAAELHVGRSLPSPSLKCSLERELGFDSLTRAELLSRVEQAFSVRLPGKAFVQIDTPAELLQLIDTSVHPGKASTQPFETGESVLSETATASLPTGAQTLPEVLAWHVAQHGERIHVHLYEEEDQPVPVSYQALFDGAAAIASGLRARRVSPGQSIAIMLPTNRDYLFSFFGILLAGAIPVPIYPPLRPAQLEDHLRRHADILENAAAVMLITVPEARAVAHLLRAQISSLEDVSIPEELAASTMGEPLTAHGHTDDIALLQYTSGSTGTPKGVMLSHSNLLANIRAMGEAVEVKPEDCFVSWLPLYHDMGLIGAWLGSLYFAIPLALMSPLSFLSRPQRWLEAIHHHRGTLSAAPNFAYEYCYSHIDPAQLEGLDLSSWRMAFNGAEPVSARTLRHFQERFSPLGFRPEAMAPVYGLAENSVGLAFPPPGRGPLIDHIQRASLAERGEAQPVSKDEESLEVVACGRPMSGHAVRIIDAAGHPLPERREGHLQFRGPSATRGYFRNPEKSAELFHDGWLDSGDLGYLANGEIYLTSRVKDLIIRGGRNLYPYELEQAVGAIEGVRKGCVAVFGSVDKNSGTEQLVVLAETRETDQAARQSIENQIVELGGQLLGIPPERVVLAPPHSVLKTSSGKIRRGATRELFEQGKIGSSGTRVWLQVVRLLLSAFVPSLRRLRRNISARLYAAYAWMMFSLFAPPAWILTQLLPNHGKRWRMLHKAAHLLRRLLGIPLDVEGRDNLPGDQPCILAVNHASYIDGILLAELLPHSFIIVAKSELRDHWVPRLFIEKLQGEFVDRSDLRAGADDALRLEQLAQSGRSLLFFPEGTFHEYPGLLPFHMGAFIAASRSGLPVMPITIRGSRQIMAGRTWFPRHGPVKVIVSPPISPAGSSWGDAVMLRNAVRKEILKHCGEPDLA